MYKDSFRTIVKHVLSKVSISMHKFSAPNTEKQCGLGSAALGLTGTHRTAWPRVQATSQGHWWLTQPPPHPSPLPPRLLCEHSATTLPGPNAPSAHAPLAPLLFPLVLISSCPVIS